MYMEGHEYNIIETMLNTITSSILGKLSNNIHLRIFILFELKRLSNYFYLYSIGNNVKHININKFKMVEQRLCS